MWPRPCEWSVEEALKQQPCGVNFKWEQQGEAIAFGEGGQHYITVSEGLSLTKTRWFLGRSKAPRVVLWHDPAPLDRSLWKTFDVGDE